MSAIDWNAKPEPWRTIGHQFLADLLQLSKPEARLTPVHTWHRRPHRYVKWSHQEITELMRLRNVEKFTWVEIGIRLGRKLGAVQSRYERQVRLERP